MVLFSVTLCRPQVEAPKVNGEFPGGAPNTNALVVNGVGCGAGCKEVASGIESVFVTRFGVV